MVTLLGFCFILVNVALLVIYMPDLVGPVRLTPPPTLLGGEDAKLADMR